MRFPFFNRGKHLRAALESADASATATRTFLAELKAHPVYLETSCRQQTQQSLAQATQGLKDAPKPWWPWSQKRKAIRHLLQTLSSLQQDVEDHNPAYVEQEMKVNVDLFALQAGNTRLLSRSQQLAIVRDDKWNLVVAAAGSGKTAALTHRIAYLLRKGVPAHRILALTFTQLAAAEMKARLQDRFGIETVNVSTFHAYGRSVLVQHRGAVPEVAKDADLPNSIRATLAREAAQPGSFQGDLLTYLALPDSTLEPQAVDFAAKEDYYKAIRDARHFTLRREVVKSLGEKQIADFLTLHGIRYVYEGIAEWVPKTPGRNNYRPDFTLPECHVTIEHWTTRDGGRVPEWFMWTPEQYHEKMAWARRTFVGKRLVETYHDECRNGTLERALRERLTAAGVPLRPLTYKQLVEEVHGFKALEGNLIELFQKWVSNAKSLGLTASDIPERLQGKSLRVQAFGRCAQRMLADFDDLLQRRHIVTYADMVHGAVALMRQHPQKYLGQYDHILVDEFQDTSYEKLEMLRALIGAKTHLFCVGDDWQSIYAFTGADVRFFRDFEHWFGPATTTLLEESHRCPVGILEAGNQLMRHNRDQIPKHVKPQSQLRDGPIVVELPEATYTQAMADHAERWILDHLASGVPPTQILVLCRYKAPLELLERRLSNRRVAASLDDKRGVPLLTVHKAKGKERDHVLLMDATLGRFPATAEDPSVLEPVRMAPDNRLEEERRLFYVALTRARRSLHIQTRASAMSPFVRELHPLANHVQVPESQIAVVATALPGQSGKDGP
ncbi:MAG: helicase [Thermoplasmata archaeon]|nr:helicase [Thermoplasmata archaeon]